MRIKNHPILEFKNKEKISFYFNNKKMYGYKGDTIASALYANNVKEFSTSIRYENPRGFFCGIGKCSSCLMTVDGIPNVRTCIAPLKENIKVETQKKFGNLSKKDFYGKPSVELEVDILVVGGGPAGLCATVEAAEQNAKVLLVDENQFLGGQLVKQTHKFFGSKKEKAGTRGIKIASDLEKQIKEFEKKDKVVLMLDSTVIGSYENNIDDKLRFGVVKKEGYISVLYDVKCKAVIFAVGAMENMLLFPGNDLPGVYGAGSVQTLMNVYGVKPGYNVLMVGAGNVGLIVSYQLLQAGVKVDRVVEAASKIGGYHVHAAKLRRCGVPIYTSHSIKEVYGEGKVEGAIVVKLDENWNEIKGTEVDIKCDTICLAVGLTPSTRLLQQMDVKIEYVSEAGGFIALHDESMMTNLKNVFVAGDGSGIEEASTAMIEGKIAGVSAVEKTGIQKNLKVLKKQYLKELKNLRAGPFGEKPRIAKQKIKKLEKKT